MLISIPPKYAVARVVGYMKGKSAIHIARTYLGQRKNYSGRSFWARGYFVSTVGADETVVRAFVTRMRKTNVSCNSICSRVVAFINLSTQHPHA